MWEKYIRILLQACLLSNPFDAQEASSLIATAEIVGAFVKIKSSDSCKSHIGRQGYVVEITKNTWRIAVPVNGSIDVADSSKIFIFVSTFIRVLSACEKCYISVLLKISAFQSFLYTFFKQYRLQ
jgi:RNase P/RNase MRP subunit p29